jgi:hypothetical protein
MTLHLCVPRCAHADDQSDPIELPFDDDEWEEFDPTPLEAWILDDFEWEIEEPYPDHADFFHDTDSLPDNDE